MTGELPNFQTEDLTKILVILMRIDAKLDLLIELEEDDGEEEDRS